MRSNFIGSSLKAGGPRSAKTLCPATSREDLSKVDFGDWGPRALQPDAPRLLTSENRLQKARVWLTGNGATKQDSTISHLIWSAAETIADLSRYFRLEPGDLIYTGTPEGFGAVVPGDLMELGIDGLGMIRARVVAG